MNTNINSFKTSRGKHVYNDTVKYINAKGEENVYITTKTYVPKTNSSKNRNVKSNIIQCY